MNEPHTAGDIRNEILRLLSRHLVAINVTDCRVDETARQFDHESYVASAFVVSVQNVWCPITAGHVLDAYYKRIKKGRKVVAVRLIDGMAASGDRPPFPAIPFPLESAHQTHVDEDGLDFGLILLSPTIVAQLHEGGIVALDESGWADAPASPESYLLLGFPEQLTEARVQIDGNGAYVHVNVGAPLLFVVRINDPPEVLKHKYEGFYAKVPEQLVVIDGKPVPFATISGMSGGPILAFDKNSRYWVIAVQSGWASQSRVLRACFIRPFLDGLAKMIEEDREQGQ